MNNYHLYFGRAGQLFVMSEFLLRSWNVAIPEVDEGDDIFVVKHETGRLMRIQVKSAQSKIQKEGFSAQFNISIKQLADVTKGYHFIFVVRHLNHWQEVIIIRQSDLFDMFDTQSLGSVHKDNLTLRLTFKNAKVSNKKINLTQYQNNFEDFIIDI
ncbi:MAG: hypothetical protein U5N85_02160 [Arcicella sp.]|nr:hypothetical protein [Arcicella sp.]